MEVLGQSPQKDSDTYASQKEQRYQVVGQEFIHADLYAVGSYRGFFALGELKILAISIAVSCRENGRYANLDPHLWVAEGGDSQSSPDGGVVGHVVTEPLGHRLVHLVRKTNVIGVHLDHMLPRRTGASQGPFDIAECLGDLIRERLRELPVIVPAALP